MSTALKTQDSVPSQNLPQEMVAATELLRPMQEQNVECGGTKATKCLGSTSGTSPPKGEQNTKFVADLVLQIKLQPSEDFNFALDTLLKLFLRETSTTERKE